MSSYKKFGQFDESTFQQFCVMEDWGATLQETVPGMSDYRSIRKPMIAFYLNKQDKIVPVTNVAVENDKKDSTEQLINSGLSKSLNAGVLREHICNFSPNDVKRVFGETFEDICKVVEEKASEFKAPRTVTKVKNMLEVAISSKPGI